MHVFKRREELLTVLKKRQPQSLGLVPTMGALHAGHLALVNRANLENDWVIVSIFVNPTQFDNTDDLANYPQSLATDLQKLSAYQGKLLVYAPETDDLYPSSVKSHSFDFGLLEKTMEGASRGGHFQGVATIVHKLFSSFMPTRAYFGEKDYQQLRIIHALVAQCSFPVEIVDCPIVREKDGLALSSRNVRLNPSQRQMAPLVYQTLLEAQRKKSNTSPSEICQWVDHFLKKQPGLTLDYFCIADAHSLQPVDSVAHNQPLRAFIAVQLGGVRLIDNIIF